MPLFLLAVAAVLTAIGWTACGLLWLLGWDGFLPGWLMLALLAVLAAEALGLWLMRGE